jgi:hypothetical protein
MDAYRLSCSNLRVRTNADAFVEGESRRDRSENHMKISDWLDQNEAEHVDVSQIVLPAGMSFDEAPEETVYFKEIKPCGALCAGNHPFSTVERFGHWFSGRGQDKKAGIHSSNMKWSLFTRDKAVALRTAKAHIE